MSKSYKQALGFTFLEKFGKTIHSHNNPSRYGKRRDQEMNVKRIIARILILCAVMCGAGQVLKAQAATVRNFTLYGSYVSGWGFSASNITSPGPVIVVDLNDVVNLTLINVDTGYYAASHRFLLSYENSSTQHSGDVVSSDIGPGQTVVLTFTANVSGTFTYYCVFHPSPMYGTFIVTPAVPEFQPLIMLSILAACTMTVALAFRRRRGV